MARGWASKGNAANRSINLRYNKGLMEAIVRYKVALRLEAAARGAAYACIYVGRASRKGA